LKRSVELAREKLGLERCAILVECEDSLGGTYGTDRQGHTTDERAQRFPKDADWIVRFGLLTRQDSHWILDDEAHVECSSAGPVTIGQGWIAVTRIQSAQRPFGFFVNDAAISHAPINPEKQEIVAAYCSLLGSIFEHRQTIPAKTG
jgi:hypothetical protein